MFVFPLPVSAATETSAGIKPGQFLYFFDTTFEKVGIFFTFGSENKAKKALEYADERLAEAEESANDNNPKAVEKAMAGYKEEISLATEKSIELKDQNKAEELLNIVSENTAKHQEVLANVLEKVPEEARQAILNAIEVSKRGQEEAVKQITELKGEIEKLKKEVAELKAKNEVQTKVTEEIKKQKSESSPARVTDGTTQAPKTTTPTPLPTLVSVLKPTLPPCDQDCERRNSMIQFLENPTLDNYKLFCGKAKFLQGWTSKQVLDSSRENIVTVYDTLYDAMNCKILERTDITIYSLPDANLNLVFQTDDSDAVRTLKIRANQRMTDLLANSKFVIFADPYVSLKLRDSIISQGVDPLSFNSVAQFEIRNAREVPMPFSPVRSARCFVRFDSCG